MRRQGIQRTTHHHVREDLQRGYEGTRRQRKRVRRLVQRLHGMPVNDDTDSDTETTPSPPSSEHECDGTSDIEGSSDSEPNTDEILGKPPTARNSSTRDDLLDDRGEPEDSDDDPELEDMRKLKRLLRERARQREAANREVVLSRKAHNYCCFKYKKGQIPTPRRGDGSGFKIDRRKIQMDISKSVEISSREDSVWTLGKNRVTQSWMICCPGFYLY